MNMRHLASFVLLFLSLNAFSQSYNIVPQPASLTETEGYYTLPEKPRVRTVRSCELTGEAYSLEVAPGGITITAGTRQGEFYARQTLAQMMAQATDGRMRAAKVSDSPRFQYRGVMLDLVRTYLPIEEVKRIADVASTLKLNRLHLHLADDNGWRLEIKKYPRLTEVGAWRVDRPGLFPGRLNARSAAEPATCGGFYTQKEMRELVKYCDERGITVVPEIEMPAHSAGLLASYPDLACPVVTKFIGVFPGIGGKDASIICCAGNDRVFEVYEGILDEVMDIFPSHYIHLGGDEADKTIWRQCPLCQKRIASEGLKDCEELQGYFMDRVNRYVRSRGREAIGWDEVTMGSPREPIAIMGWRGDGAAAIGYARRTGAPFILTPAKRLYLIRYQGPQWFEPFTYFGNNTLRDCYLYEPVGDDWTDRMRESLLGIQGSMWNEFCPTAADMQYMIFPRLVAVADVAWAQPGRKDWPAFLKALDAYLPTLDAKGMTYARSMFNIQHTVVPDGKGGLRVTLECERPDVEIRYALSPSVTAQCPQPAVAYKGSFVVSDTETCCAAAFINGEQVGETLTLRLHHNKATGRTVSAPACNNGLASRLVNGLSAGDRISDGEWAGWYNRDAEFTVDLDSVQTIRRVTLSGVAHADICVAAPLATYVYTSLDCATWTLLGKTECNEPFHPTAQPLTSSFYADSLTARYIYVRAVNPGPIPDGYAREGTATWLYFNELQVE